MDISADIRPPIALRIASALFDIEAAEPKRGARLTLWITCLLIAVLIVWAFIAQLDIVAVANGRLVPQTYVKIVQPAEAGIIREILVAESDTVEQGQVLVRLDPTVNAVDSAATEHELALQRLQLRRIEAELAGTVMSRDVADVGGLFAQVDAHRVTHHQTFLDSMAQERAARDQSRSELAASGELLEKLEVTLPSYLQSAKAYEDLAERRLVGELEAIERRRDAIEVTQDLEAQRATVASLEAAIVHHDQRLAQIASTYASELNQTRMETVVAINRLEQELGKLEFQKTLLELRAPQAGVVKDMVTTTVGAVVEPGTVLVTLVPHDEPLWAEVMIENKDIGFVTVHQAVRVKLAAYQFQKYGMLEGTVKTVSADSSEGAVGAPENATDYAAPIRRGPVFKVLIELKNQKLHTSGFALPLAAGMQVSAEIMQGKRTVLEYLLSPIQRIASEAGMER